MTGIPAIAPTPGIERSERLFGQLLDARPGFASELRARAAEIVLDVVAAQLACVAKQASVLQIAAEFVEDEGGNPRASVVGVQRLTSAALAAFANGTAAYALDLEPVQVPSVTHAAAAVVPAAIAVGETFRVQGAAVLDATIAGLETADRIGRALGVNQLYARGFHPSAVTGSVAAAVAACRVAGIRSETAARAIGLAATQSCGLMAWQDDPSEHSRPFNPGVSARNGVVAALLAAKGFGGPLYALEGPRGLLHAFGSDSARDELTVDLGERWAVEHTQFKRYPVCAFLQSVVEATIAAKERLGRPVCEARVELPSGAVGVVSGEDLRSHSARYVTAVILREGAIDIDDILIDRRMDDRTIAECCSLVEVGAAPDLDRFFPDSCPARVTLRSRDHCEASEVVLHPLGHPKNGFSSSLLNDKFLMLAKGALPDGRTIEELRQRIINLETEVSIQPVMTVMRQAMTSSP